jgi:hypothetical protein
VTLYQRRLQRAAEVSLETLQREGEERARAYWDPDEAPEFVGQLSPLSTALARALEDAKEALDNGPNKTPFLGEAYLTEYLKSDHWKAVRGRALLRAGGYCAGCRRQMRHLEVHHLTYRNLGQEKESDLMVLCHRCHEKEHGRRW